MRRGLLILAAGLTLLAPVTGQQAGEQGPKGQVTIKERATLKGHSGEVWPVAYSPDGRTLASGSWDKTIKLWEMATGKERAMLKGKAFFFTVAYSPDGRTLATGSWSERTIKLWDVATGKKRSTLKGH